MSKKIFFQYASCADEWPNPASANRKRNLATLEKACFLIPRSENRLYIRNQAH
jgi:hypothetical protein